MQSGKWIGALALAALCASATAASAQGKGETVKI